MARIPPYPFAHNHRFRGRCVDIGTFGCIDFGCRWWRSIELLRSTEYDFHLEHSEQRWRRRELRLRCLPRHEKAGFSVDPVTNGRFHKQERQIVC
ncbi:hypothetical protein ZIOFF_037078 [Zingiber officinale]|uniref:Uncharacterized protein n=1 Tax=Zingiber officinale TaxID=94328 RepID=A0A8J5L905_ZINOF|nr:hypothetical protein ZIOFF_037078 [Zingiber officinale]